jgi:hypothetical protein
VTAHFNTQERVYPVEATRKLVLRRYRGAPAGWVKHPGPPVVSSMGHTQPH